MKVKLKDIIIEVNERTTKNNQYPILTSSQNGIFLQEEYFKKNVASKNNIGYKIIRKGEFTYRSMSDTGNFTINRLENIDIGIVSPAYPVFKCNGVNPDYLKYYFSSNNFKRQIDNLYQGGTRVALKLKDLENIEIEIPTEDEQTKIVKLLKNLDNLISRYEEAVKEKEQFIKSQFVEMFEHNNGICMKTLKMVTSFQQGTQVPIEQQTDEMLEGYKRFLRIIDYTQPPQEARYVNVKGKEVDERSVVVVRYGASSGFVGRGYSGVLANNLFEIHPKNNCISKDFLYYSLKYGSFESVINKKASGAAMPAISFNMIEDIMIPIPDIELQNRFADIVQLIDKQKFQQLIDNIMKVGDVA